MEFNVIKSNLELLDGMDRLSYLIDLGRINSGIPENLRKPEHRIIGCVSTAYLIVNKIKPRVSISTESDSEFVKGLLYILKIYIENKTIDEINKINEVELMGEIGIKNSITSQRLNGFYSAIKKLKEIINKNE